MESFVPPGALGLPSKFSAWRKHQPDAILKMVGNDKRTLLSVCPTGFGKSVSVIAAGIILGAKTVVLTSTKALQEQYMRDFAGMGMVDVRGKNSYPCAESKGKLTCDQGMCNFGIWCPLRAGGCEYYDAVRRATQASLVVTNYSFWLYSNKYGDGIGKPGLLICDEGHDAPAEVADFLTVKLDRSDKVLLRILPERPQATSIPEWRAWAVAYSKNLSRDVEVLQGEIREYGPDEFHLLEIAKRKRVLDSLTILSGMDAEDWVCNVTPFEVEFAPITVKSRCQAVLFRDVKKVILTSASVNYKTAEMLGINDETCNIVEYPHSFPVENRLVYLLHGARLNAKADGETLVEWLKIADSIIENRLDRKGVFHTTAYHRRDFVMDRSRFSPYMISHNRKDVVEIVERFRESSPPKILVSPSVTTGWDFPYDACEYQILGKVPYPDTRNVITAARVKADKDYAPYIAMQQIIQACGRGCRAEDDFCENFIIDSNIKWFIGKYGKFAPKWFRDSITSRMFAPEPPPPLRKRRMR